MPSTLSEASETTHRSDAFRGEELYDFLQGAMRLGGENLAPLVGENARNCHSSLPFSGGLVWAAASRDDAPGIRRDQGHFFGAGLTQSAVDEEALLRDHRAVVSG